jgi:prepilin-type N-terminal cleavage/methylation domain-containing protein
MGFTLVELLVVIVIIATLAAIGFPAANRLRTRAADQKCVGQLKAWGSTIALYAADSGGQVECRKWNSLGQGESVYTPYLTSEGSTDSRKGPLAQMRCCPALKGRDALSGNGNSLTAYAMTDASSVTSLNLPASYNLSQIRTPSRFVTMIEVTNVRTPAIIRTVADYTSMVRPLTVAPRIRHRDKAPVVNALMGDFSVSSYTSRDIDRYVVNWTTF